MKKMVFLLLISFVIIGTLTACRGRDTATPAATGPFPGVIALITNDVSQNEEEFRSAEAVVARYGPSKVTHVTWPTNFMAEQEQMVTIVARLAAMREVNALLINQSVPGTIASLDRLRQTRDDVFVILAAPQENPNDVARRANLVMNNDDFARGPAFVRQAQAMGARTIIHYSFPRHLGIVTIAARRELMRDEAQRLGIEFIDATAPDPTGDAGITGTQQFMLEDVPRMITRHGTDTAFFGTNCAMMPPLITRVIEGRALFPEPCDPSPTHGFPSALGIDATGRGTDMPWMIEQIKIAVAERGMTGRLSTWPAPASMAWTGGGTNYAIKVLNGQAPRDRIDVRLLHESFSTYFTELLGNDVSVGIRAFPDPATGRDIENYMLVLMDHLTF